MGKQYQGKAKHSKGKEPSFFYCAYRTVKGLVKLSLVVGLTMFFAISMLTMTQLFRIWF
jgi:hypothetical protein